MHPEVLKLEQKKIFEKLIKFPEFYLVGGTALALQIGHRRSVDFDLFSEKDISPNLSRKIRRVFEKSQIEFILRHSEQLSVVIDNTKVDFVKYRFPLVLKPVEFKGVKMAQAAEIVAMKAYALNHRATLKDYVDLYFALKKKYVTLDEVNKFSEKKYGDEFNFRLFLEQLIYWEDVKRENIEFLVGKPTEEEMKKFFEKEIKKLKL